MGIFFYFLEMTSFRLNFSSFFFFGVYGGPI